MARVKSPWTRQPQYPVRVDTSFKWDSVVLPIIGTPTQLHDLITDKLPTVGNSSYGIKPSCINGHTLCTGGSAGGVFAWPIASAGTNETTLLVVYTPESVDDYWHVGNLVAKSNGSGGTVQTSIRYDESGSNVTFTFGHYDSANRTIVSGNYSKSVPHTVLGRFSTTRGGTSGTGGAELWVDGVLVATDSITGSLTTLTTPCMVVGRGDTGANNLWSSASRALMAVSDSYIPNAAEISRNPWAIFQPQVKIIFAVSAGGGTHASSGALTSDSATIAGSGTHVSLHPSSGALSASNAVIAGSSTRFGLRPSSGALSAGDAITAGSATRYGLRPSSGDLTAQSASVAGTAAHIGIHQSSGDLTSGSAVIDGTGTETPAPGNTHPSSGALSAGSAGIAGTAAHIALHPSSGALSADNATVAGIAAHIGIHASSGALEAQSAVVSGSAINGIARNSSGGYLVETLSEKRRLRRHLEEAQEVVQRIKKPSVSQDAAEALQEDAAEISRQLKASIAELEAVAENYQKQLDQKASFKAFAAKQEAKEQARQIQALMIDAQIHAELAQQQIEELDVVFMAFALMAYV